MVLGYSVVVVELVVSLVEGYSVDVVVSVEVVVSVDVVVSVGVVLEPPPSVVEG